MRWLDEKLLGLIPSELWGRKIHYHDYFGTLKHKLHFWVEYFLKPYHKFFESLIAVYEEKKIFSLFPCKIVFKIFKFFIIVLLLNTLQLFFNETLYLKKKGKTVNRQSFDYYISFCIQNLIKKIRKKMYDKNTYPELSQLLPLVLLQEIRLDVFDQFGLSLVQPPHDLVGPRDRVTRVVDVVVPPEFSFRLALVTAILVIFVLPAVILQQIDYDISLCVIELCWKIPGVNGIYDGEC